MHLGLSVLALVPTLGGFANMVECFRPHRLQVSGRQQGQKPGLIPFDPNIPPRAARRGQHGSSPENQPFGCEFQDSVDRNQGLAFAPSLLQLLCQQTSFPS